MLVRLPCSIIIIIVERVVCAVDVGSERNQFNRLLFLLTDIDCVPPFDLFFRFYCFILAAGSDESTQSGIELNATKKHTSSEMELSMDFAFKRKIFIHSHFEVCGDDVFDVFCKHVLGLPCYVYIFVFMCIPFGRPTPN